MLCEPLTTEGVERLYREAFARWPLSEAYNFYWNNADGVVGCLPTSVIDFLSEPQALDAQGFIAGRSRPDPKTWAWVDQLGIDVPHTLEGFDTWNTERDYLQNRVSDTIKRLAGK